MKVPFAKSRSAGSLLGLDHADKQLLAALSRVRRAVAATATARKQLELQLGQLTEQDADYDGDTPRPGIDLELEAIRRRYTAAQQKEQRSFEASQRLQVKIDEFRFAKQAAEAAYLAAEDALNAAQAEIARSA